MASKDKPYRVYKGGRAKGPIRHEPLKHEDGGSDGDAYAYKGPKPARKPRRWRRRMLWVLVGLIVLSLVWALLGYLAFRRGVKDANKRLDPLAARALTPQDGLMLVQPEQHPRARGRRGQQEQAGNAGPLGLDRPGPDGSRPSPHRAPLDPARPQGGHPPPRPGEDQRRVRVRRPTLAIKTVERVTGLPINHVVVVDFSTFAEVVDALGGMTVKVPQPILSNKFECPSATQAACARWPGWRFRKGQQDDGRAPAL